MFDDLPVDQSAKGSRRLGYAAREQSPDLVKQTAVELQIDPVRDARRDLIVRENRRYARRQLIWFRKEPNLMWFDGPGESPDVQARVLGWLAERGLLIDGGPAAHA